MVRISASHVEDDLCDSALSARLFAHDLHPVRCLFELKNMAIGISEGDGDAAQEDESVIPFLNKPPH